MFIFKNCKIVPQCMRMLIFRQEAGCGRIVPIRNQGEGHHEFYRKIGSECLWLRITGSSLEFLGKMECEFMNPRATESKPELLVSRRLGTHRSVTWRAACAAGKMKLLRFVPRESQLVLSVETSSRNKLPCVSLPSAMTLELQSGGMWFCTLSFIEGESLF